MGPQHVADAVLLVQWVNLLAQLVQLLVLLAELLVQRAELLARLAELLVQLLVLLLAELQLPQSWVQNQQGALCRHSQRRCLPTAAHSSSCAPTKNVCHAPSLKRGCMLHFCTLNQCMSSMQGLYPPCQLCFVSDC